ncbi:MAG: PhnD/SsuA/transferrin family substrate-binding protein [Desulfobacterales bacterium]|jgi:ABC-type phosphate/phosphonate transport system substrate-binding protein
MLDRRKHITIRRINPIFLTFLIFLLPSGPFSQPLNAQSTTFYFLFHDPEWGFSNSIEAIERLSPFCDFLSETLHKRISPLYLKQQHDIEAHLSTPEVLFGLLNATVVSQKQNKFDLKPFLLPIRKGKITHRKVLLIPSHLKVKDISELEGKRLAVLTSDLNSLQKQLSLVTSNPYIDPHRFFGSMVKATSTESAISSMRLKLSDCALVALDGFELVKQKNPDLGEQFKKLYLSPPVPNSPVVQIGERMTPGERSNLKAALSSLAESESGKKLLRLIYVDAFQGPPRPEIIATPSPAREPETETLPVDVVETPPHPEIIAKHSPAKEPEAETPSVDTAEALPRPEIIAKSSPTRESEKETIDYLIKKGDTLWDLAEKYLGAGHKYQILADINQIKNPHKIWAGGKLKIVKQRKSAE